MDGAGKDWLAHTPEVGECGIALTSEFGARFEGEEELKRVDELYGPFRLKTPGKLRLEREAGR
ncbi:unnamed protein product [[Actinomadura] parvosata subsp. kistnae]|nr:unnamed protein product [Actinomadura parvosata subsp. kistnae]